MKQSVRLFIMVKSGGFAQVKEVLSGDTVVLVGKFFLSWLIGSKRSDMRIKLGSMRLA